MSAEFTVIFALAIYIATFGAVLFELRSGNRPTLLLVLTPIISAIFIVAELFLADALHLFGLFVTFSCSWALLGIRYEEANQSKSDDAQASA